MLESQHILVAVAWPYSNGPRHIGHVAGFGVPSDVFARFQRLRGNRVLMVSGTDDHGTPITYGADAEGISPRAFSDRYNAVIVEDLKNLGLSYDLFTRTATSNHYRVVQDLFLKLHERGYLIKKTQLGAISPSTGRTLPDRFIEGTCPICGYPEARGDQCDNCGNQLDPADLINPRSRINGETPNFVETEHFFFDLPAFAEALQDWISKQQHWRPNVRRFSENYIAELKPRAITRDLDWGVPIPLPDWRDRDDKRIYVWFDAVIGYLSASIEWAQLRGQPDAWKEWWTEPEALGYYFMGKDNITFHTVMWPAILLGAGGLNLPYEVVSSEFLTMEGRRFSTSRNVVIYVRDVLERYDADALRYFLTIAGPETQDADFTWAEFVRRNNDELVGTWGNLVHRTLVNAHRNFGAVPEPGELNERDSGLLEAIEGGFATTADLYGRARFKAAVSECLRLSALVNQYLGEEQPWHVIKTDRARAGSVLYVALQCVNALKVMFTPVLPFAGQRLHQMLGFDEVLAPMPEAREVGEGEDRHRVLMGDYPEVNVWQAERLPAGRALPEPKALFKKLDEGVIDDELRRMGGD
ncbi:MAG TPA: methionine--tRNA ligase [Candidatus Dormibacteraeota bacterium]